MTSEERALPFQLATDERIEAAAWTEPAVLAVTDRRMVIGTESRVSLDVPIEAIRRIQLDVERGRPGTLVIVPHHPSDEPQVLAIPHDQLEATTHAVFVLGDRLRRFE